MAAPTHPGPAPGRRWMAVKPWIQIQELPGHLAHLVPFLLGTVLAYFDAGVLNWAIFLVALAGLYLLTEGTHLASESFDVQADPGLAPRRRSDGTGSLVHGLIPTRHVRYAAIACFLVAIPLGLWLRYGLGTGPLTLWLGALAIGIGWFYSAPPVRASHHGLGERFVAVGQGLVIFGAYYVQQGASLLPAAAALAWFVALPALKVLREVPGAGAGQATGRRSLATVFGHQRMSTVSGVMIVVAIALLVPVFLMLDSLLAALLLVPAALLGRSAWLTLAGRGRDPAQREAAAVSAYAGMLLVPVMLTLIFLIAGLRRW